MDKPLLESNHCLISLLRRQSEIKCKLSIDCKLMVITVMEENRYLCGEEKSHCSLKSQLQATGHQCPFP